MAKRTRASASDATGSPVEPGSATSGAESHAERNPGSGGGSSDGSTVDLANVPGAGSGTGAGGDTGERRPRSDRGRPRGPRKAKETISVGNLKQILLTSHASLALIAQAPSIAIADSEAGLLAETLGNVAQWYDIPEVGQKSIDHFNLFMALVTVYGTRLFAVANRAKAAKPAPQAQPAPQAPPGMWDGSTPLEVQHPPGATAPGNRH